MNYDTTGYSPWALLLLQKGAEHGQVGDAEYTAFYTVGSRVNTANDAWIAFVVRGWPPPLVEMWIAEVEASQPQEPMNVLDRSGQTIGYAYAPGRGAVLNRVDVGPIDPDSTLEQPMIIPVEDVK